MRTTVRIDDELLRELKAREQREDVSLTKLLNRVIRSGLAAGETNGRKKRPYREKTCHMGVPLVDLTKALALSMALEDEAVIEKMARGK